MIAADLVVFGGAVGKWTYDYTNALLFPNLLDNSPAIGDIASTITSPKNSLESGQKTLACYRSQEYSQIAAGAAAPYCRLGTRLTSLNYVLLRKHASYAV